MSDSDYGNLNFSDARWEKVQRDSAAWWRGELKRPLLQARAYDWQSPRAPAKTPYADLTIAMDSAVEDLIDSWDYELSRYLFLGDAFPAIWLNYGPGVAAAFLGCRAEVSRQNPMTVWFHPEKIVELNDLKFASPAEADNNYLWRRMNDIITAADKKWHGKLQIGLTDLGGTLDILSSFRPSEALLYDLADEPEKVIELTWEIHRRWWDFYARQTAALKAAGNRGTTCWTPIFSAESYYLLQCDFNYMLGPKQFEKFVLPELRASCQKLDHAFYHLDGIGQLASLDLLLSIPELKGVQWVPGSGQPEIEHWSEVLRKISDAGKKIQIGGDARWTSAGAHGREQFEKIVDTIGRADNIVCFLQTDQADRAEMEKFLAKWGA